MTAWFLLCLQLAFLGALVYGVAQFNEGAAWVVGGLLGALVVERMPDFLSSLPAEPKAKR